MEWRFTWRASDRLDQRRLGILLTYHGNISFAEGEYTMKFLTMHSCKGLEFPLAAIPGVRTLRVDKQLKGEVPPATRGDDTSNV